MNNAFFRCNAVNYRQGFLEVTPNIHSGCINLEAWNVHPDVDITKLNMPAELVSDECIEGNVELELDLNTAEQLVKALQAAIAKSKSVQQEAES